MDMIVQNYVGRDISKQWLADMIAAYVASDGHGKSGRCLSGAAHHFAEMQNRPIYLL
jgi:hypothetical protein